LSVVSLKAAPAMTLRSTTRSTTPARANRLRSPYPNRHRGRNRIKVKNTCEVTSYQIASWNIYRTPESNEYAMKKINLPYTKRNHRSDPTCETQYLHFAVRRQESKQIHAYIHADDDAPPKEPGLYTESQRPQPHRLNWILYVVESKRATILRDTYGYIRSGIKQK
jgi:hypothetical protein